MKFTIFLLIILLFSAGSIRGQNKTSVVKKNDKKNHDHFNQQGNDEISDQRIIGDNNTTLVNQRGTNNKTFSLSIGDENTVRIWQNGDNNKSGTDGLLDLGLLQLGNFNDFESDQSGKKNTSNAQQAGEHNLVRVYQSVHNQSEILQIGNSNCAKNEQTGERNKSEVAQTGISNSTDIIQTSDDNELKLIQLLNGNFARIEQNTGNLNKVNLIQSDGAKAVINQSGAKNVLMGLGLSIMALSLDGSTLDLNQIGDENIVHLQQRGGSNHAIINQYGN